LRTYTTSRVATQIDGAAERLEVAARAGFAYRFRAFTIVEVPNALRCFDQTSSRFDRPGVAGRDGFVAIPGNNPILRGRHHGTAVIRRDGSIEPGSCTEALSMALCLLLRLTPDQPIQVSPELLEFFALDFLRKRPEGPRTASSPV
jgi:hypothetical protein